ncbi:outer membrane lipoprotein-sorting protein [candidate division KSB1 bacterium]|nr:outer membrane lipoprotein-sorting protein [candidate division KSB1 bacterium]
MKNIFLTIYILTFSAGFSQDLSPKEIIQKIDANERVEASQGVMKQTITTSGGSQRTLEMKAYSKDRNDKQLLAYTAPARVKGDKILMLNNGNDIWFYTPKTDRVRHLASHARRQKVQGSDFAYEDMAGGNLLKDYIYTLLGEEKTDGVDCYKFELIPTESGPHYSKLILWADKNIFFSIRIDYYEDGELLKRLRLSDIQRIDDHWTAMKMVMTNLQEGGQTVMETESISFDTKLDDSIFTTQNLKRR